MAVGLSANLGGKREAALWAFRQIIPMPKAPGPAFKMLAPPEGMSGHDRKFHHREKEEAPTANPYARSALTLFSLNRILRAFFGDRLGRN